MLAPRGRFERPCLWGGKPWGSPAWECQDEMIIQCFISHFVGALISYLWALLHQWVCWRIWPGDLLLLLFFKYADTLCKSPCVRSVISELRLWHSTITIKISGWLGCTLAYTRKPFSYFNAYAHKKVHIFKTLHTVTHVLQNCEHRWVSICLFSTS